MLIVLHPSVYEPLDLPQPYQVTIATPKIAITPPCGFNVVTGRCQRPGCFRGHLCLGFTEE